MIPCFCPICKAHHQNPKEFNFQDILFHNYHMMKQELSKVQNSIQQQSLREHVSVRISNSSHLTSIIRYFESDSYQILEKRTPRYKPSILQATNIDVINRPEIKRFQQQIINNYQKPTNTSILLLLPCSAKKPYSFSKTHKKFIRSIQSVPNYHCIHECIITSPLGLVPRDLELMYPASSYDIPVTHNWFEDEKQMINKILEGFLSINKYQTIILYLTESLKSSISSAFPFVISSEIITSPTSQIDLKALISLLSNQTTKNKIITSSQRRLDDMTSRLTFQFSKKMAEKLLKNTTIKGKYPYLKIINGNNQQLGMLTEKRGMISLTMKGAEQLTSFHQFYVDISNDFTLKGSVFVPGIIDADPNIRKGDEVLVFQNECLRGVGVAQMNGEEMVNRIRGKAVDIRHCN
jgi:archaeosine synthase